MWRGDRGASCTPSGKGQGGILAVHLMKRGIDVWLNTRATFQRAADQKRNTMPADGCAICVQLSVFKPARLKSGALYT